ncbi:MAG: hypothetical protein AAFV77_08650 [Planctomycetota bacterium]
MQRERPRAIEQAVLIAQPLTLGGRDIVQALEAINFFTLRGVYDFAQARKQFAPRI